MNELLHLENREAAERLAAKMAVRLQLILADPVLALQASLCGTDFPELG